MQAQLFDVRFLCSMQGVLELVSGSSFRIELIRWRNTKLDAYLNIEFDFFAFVHMILVYIAGQGFLMVYTLHLNTKYKVNC